MINVPSTWRRTLFSDKRNYKNYIKITLINNTVLNLTNEHIWEGGVALDDAVSSESDFQIGSAIINKATFTINNIYGDYDAYDFIGARVEYKVGLDVGDVTDEVIKKGKYVISNATYNGQTISIEAYDYLYFFDIPYVHPNVTYPATIDAIVRAMCTEVGVTLATLNFPHKNHVIQKAPSSQQVTYREVLSWCAQICGCFARCNNEGQLELKWYPQSDLTTVMSGLDGGHFDSSNPYSSGDTANGGTFNPWSTGYVFDSGSLNWNYNVHLINSIYSQTMSVDDVVITGIRATIKVEGEDEEDEGSSEKTVTVGQSGYVIDISGNEFLTIDNVDDVLAWLGVQLIGFTFRKASVTHASDPSIEAGDCAIVFDRHRNAYPIVVSVTRFTSGNTQSTVSAAQNPLRNSAARFTAETKNYVDLRSRLQNEKTTRELMETQLADAVANSNGLYLTTETVGNATKYYLHNKPLLAESAIRIQVSSAGITVTSDSGAHWYGLTASGDMITHLLSATGINADWINSGAISISDGNGNETFYANTATGVVRINAKQIKINSSSIASQSDITALSNQISSKVSAGDIASTINQTAQSVLINASKINMSGFVEFSDLSTSGSSTINGDNVSTGTISATSSRFKIFLNLGQIQIYGNNNTNYCVILDSAHIDLDAPKQGSQYYATFTRMEQVDDNTIGGQFYLHSYGSAKFDFTNVNFVHDASISGNFTVSGTKNREVDTDDYGKRLLYCYETATPYFGDIGSCVIGSDGYSYIQIDPILLETISNDDYHVFLQKCGSGDCYVERKERSYFVVCGTPNLKFSWELKAKQCDFDQRRLEDSSNDCTIYETDFGKYATDHINEIKTERMGM